MLQPKKHQSSWILSNKNYVLSAIIFFLSVNFVISQRRVEVKLNLIKEKEIHLSPKTNSIQIGDTLILTMTYYENNAPKFRIYRGYFGDFEGMKSFMWGKVFNLHLEKDEKGNYTIVDVQGRWRLRKLNYLVLKNIKILSPQYNRIFENRKRIIFQILYIDEFKIILVRKK